MSDDEDVTAAELALGILEGEERAAAMRRLLADPEFAREVETWRTHFAVMFAEVPAAEPPARLLRRIEAALAPRGRARYVWPAIAGALAASLLLALFLRGHESPRPAGPAVSPTLVATLQAANKAASVPAIYDRGRGEIRIAGNIFDRADRSAELWLIGGDGVPRSLGVLPAHGRAVVSVSSEIRAAMVAGSKLAVSSEPRGGSPSGQPTGPILGVGALVSL